MDRRFFALNNLVKENTYKKNYRVYYKKKSMLTTVRKKKSLSKSFLFTKNSFLFKHQTVFSAHQTDFPPAPNTFLCTLL